MGYLLHAKDGGSGQTVWSLPIPAHSKQLTRIHLTVEVNQMTSPEFRRWEDANPQIPYRL